MLFGNTDMPSRSLHKRKMFPVEITVFYSYTYIVNRALIINCGINQEKVNFRANEFAISRLFAK